jgi:Na+/melibiose symporter-like transporter
VIAFFNRFSNAINLIVIGIVFTGTGWGEFTPKPGVNTLLGIRFLIGIWPVFIIAIALVCLYFWPIDQERLAKNEKLMNALHAKKRERTRDI